MVVAHKPSLSPSAKATTLDSVLDRVLISSDCGISRALQALHPEQELYRRLGPLSDWPIELKLALHQLISTSTPSSLLWNDGRFFFENDPLMLMLGRPLDAAQGFVKTGSVNNQDTWTRMQQLYNQVFLRGKPIQTDSSVFVVYDAQGALTEIVCSMSFDPVFSVSDAGLVLGSKTEYTQQTEFEALSRSMAQILRLDERLGFLPKQADVVPVLLGVLGEKDTMRDYPLSLIYHVSYPSIATPGKSIELNLLGTTGLPAEHTLCPRTLKTDGQAHLLQFEKVIHERQITSQLIPASVTRDISSMNCIPDSRQIKFDSIPIVVGHPELDGQDQVDYVLVLATNPMTVRQDVTSNFAGMARHYLETALNRIQSFEAEARARESSKQAIFLRSMMHELTNPLQLVLGPATELGALLKEYQSREQQAQAVTESDRSEVRLRAFRLTNFISLNAKRLKNQLDLMTLQLNDSVELTANCLFEDVDLFASLREVTNEFSPSFRVKNIDVELDLSEPEKSTDTWLDIDHWRSLLTTLFGIICQSARSDSKLCIKRRAQRFGVQLHLTFRPSCQAQDCNGIRIRDEAPRAPSEANSASMRCQCDNFRIERASLLARINKLNLQAYIREDDNECEYVLGCVLGNDHLDPDKCLVRTEVATPKALEVGNLVKLSTRSIGCTAVSPEACRRRRSICPLHSQILIVESDERMASYVQSVMQQDFDHVRILSSADLAVSVLEADQDDGPMVVIASAASKLEGSNALHVAQFVFDAGVTIPIILLSSMTMTKKFHLLGDLFAKIVPKPFDQDTLRSAVLQAMVRARDQRDAQLYDLFNRYVQVAFFKVDQAGQLQRYSDHWWQLTKHVSSGMSWIESVFSSDRGYCEEWWKKGLEHGFKSALSFRIGENEADCLSVELRCVACDSPGEDGWIGVLTDCTERTRASERLLREQQARADEAIETKRKSEAFIDLVCHEIRNPINAIKHNNEFVMDDLAALSQLLHNQGSLTIAQAEELLQSSKRSSEVIHECNEHQSRITDDVLNVSKLELNLIEIVQEPFTPVDKVRQLCALFDMTRFRGRGPRDNIVESQSSVESMPEVECLFGGLLHKQADQQVLGDWPRISQCLVNLLGNALKFSRGSRNPKVIVSAWLGSEVPFKSPLKPIPQASEKSDESGLYLRISVKDNGRGISKIDQDKLFERFQQASPKTYAQFSGSGLGLWITKALISLQGGAIRIDSEEGQGAEFSFYVKVSTTQIQSMTHEVVTASSSSKVLPTSPEARASAGASPSPAHVISPGQASGNDSAPRTSFQTETIPRRRILVVEDNQVNQQILKRLLTALGQDVQCADNGKLGYECWRSAREVSDQSPNGADPVAASPKTAPFDLIFMDLEMPVLGGLDACRLIRKHEGETTAKGLVRHVPICAVTGNARKEHLEAALESGMDDWLTKPYTRERISNVLLALGANK